jgi:restriction system protein
MSLPTYDQFIEPILRFLASRPDGAPAREAQEAAALALKLTQEQRQATIASGQTTYKNRAGWAHDRLKRSGLSSSAKRGFWKLTEAGLAFGTPPRFP